MLFRNTGNGLWNLSKIVGLKMLCRTGAIIYGSVAARKSGRCPGRNPPIRLILKLTCCTGDGAPSEPAGEREPGAGGARP